MTKLIINIIIVTLLSTFAFATSDIQSEVKGKKNGMTDNAHIKCFIEHDRKNDTLNCLVKINKKQLELGLYLSIVNKEQEILFSSSIEKDEKDDKDDKDDKKNWVVYRFSVNKALKNNVALYVFLHDGMHILELENVMTSSRIN